MRAISAGCLLVLLLAGAAPGGGAAAECTTVAEAGVRAYACRETVDGADVDRRARWGYAYAPLPGASGVAPDGKIEARVIAWSTENCRDRADGRFCYERNEFALESTSRVPVAPVGAFYVQVVTYEETLDGREGYCVVALRSSAHDHETHDCRLTPEALP